MFPALFSEPLLDAIFILYPSIHVILEIRHQVAPPFDAPRGKKKENKGFEHGRLRIGAQVQGKGKHLGAVRG